VQDHKMVAQYNVLPVGMFIPPCICSRRHHMSSASFMLCRSRQTHVSHRTLNRNISHLL